MNYAALLYDPIYETFGVAASLTLNRPEFTPVASPSSSGRGAPTHRRSSSSAPSVRERSSAGAS